MKKGMSERGWMDGWLDGFVCFKKCEVGSVWVEE